jgi:hypothetical protein
MDGSEAATVSAAYFSLSFHIVMRLDFLDFLLDLPGGQYISMREIEYHIFFNKTNECTQMDD